MRRTMPRLKRLTFDPRPPAYDSVTEATPADDTSVVVDDAIECAEWRGITPPDGTFPPPAFVDGVQRIDARFAADGDGWPIPGVLASYAAGGMCPSSADPLRLPLVERVAVLARGARPGKIVARISSGEVMWQPASAPGDDADALSSAVMHLRADLEAKVVRRLSTEHDGLTVADGRLPPDMGGNVVGLIKTLHTMPITDPAKLDVLASLRRGQRSPLFLRRRSDREYYAWFVCLRTAARYEHPFSGLALLEMDAESRDEAVRAANATAALLPRYASTPQRDARAPQNLLPVGQLERALRHRLGDALFVHRLLREAFSREDVSWAY